MSKGPDLARFGTKQFRHGAGTQDQSNLDALLL